MNKFFERLPLDAATQMEQLSRLQYELRENRSVLLSQYDVADEAALLELIVAGSIAEHPAYEHYLGACVIAKTRDEVNAELKSLLKELGG